MAKRLRYTPYVLALPVYLLSAHISWAACASVNQYDLLAPIGTLSGCVDLATYLKGILETTIGIAGVLAVIMIVICGIQMMASGSAGGKSAAKECITNAVLGVLLAVGSWLLLNTINPLLLKNTQTLPNIAVLTTPAAAGPTTAPMPTEQGWFFRYRDAAGNIKNSPKYDTSEVCTSYQKSEAANGSVIQAGPNQADGSAGPVGCFEIRQAAQPAGEISTRNSICGNDTCISGSNSNVYINRASCNPANANGVVYHCTNVDGLPSDAISVIKGLTGSCGKIIITGGTESGHTTHAPGLPIFDLSKGAACVTFIKANGTGPNPSFCKKDAGGGSTCYQKWLYNNYWFTDEGDHWHVCKENTAAPSPEKTNVFRKACTKI